MPGTTNFFHLSLLLAALLCTLVFGFALIFAIVIMPGIGQLDNGGFLRAFQVIDGIIQNNQPLFVIIWLGSIVMILVTAGIGQTELDRPNRIFLALSAIFYLFAQVTTFSINVPLNNRVQILKIAELDETSKLLERQAFEAKWLLWNNIRTVIFGLVSIHLLILLLIEDY